MTSIDESCRLVITSVACIQRPKRSTLGEASPFLRHVPVPFYTGLLSSGTDPRPEVRPANSVLNPGTVRCDEELFVAVFKDYVRLYEPQKDGLQGHTPHACLARECEVLEAPFGLRKLQVNMQGAAPYLGNGGLARPS